MKAKQMTPWFPSSVKPVRQGVYKTTFKCAGGQFTGYSYWDGYTWTNQARDPDRALVSGTRHANQKKRWRGLASNPMNAGHTSKGQP